MPSKPATAATPSILKPVGIAAPARDVVAVGAGAFDCLDTELVALPVEVAVDECVVVPFAGALLVRISERVMLRDDDEAALELALLVALGSGAMLNALSSTGRHWAAHQRS